MLHTIRQTDRQTDIQTSLIRSVCHIRALCSNHRRFRHNFFCIWQSHVSNTLH